MRKYKIAVLDDYQNVAIESADWSVLRDQADIAVFQDRLADSDAVIERLLPFDVVCVMRARGLRSPATSLIAFPISSSLPRRDLQTRRIDVAAASEYGIVVVHTGYRSNPTIRTSLNKNDRSKVVEIFWRFWLSISTQI